MRALVLLCCAACTGTAGPQLEIDVETSDGFDGRVYVGVSFAEPDRPCECTSDRFPASDTCIRLSDALSCHCTPAPASCVTRVALERGGATLDETSHLGVAHASLAVAPPLDGASLVVEGCGGRAEIPLARAARPAPVITAVHADRAGLVVRWTPAGGDTAVLHATNWLGGAVCRGDADGELTAGPPPQAYISRPCLAEYWLRERVTTALGEVRLWDRAQHCLDTTVDFNFPPNTVTWVVPTANPTATLKVNNQTLTATLDRFGVVPGVGGSFHLDTPGSEEVSFYAGAASDRIGLRVSSDYLEATIPHVTPTMTATSFAIDIPAVTVRSMTNSTTRIVTFGVRTDFAPLPALF